MWGPLDTLHTLRTLHPLHTLHVRPPFCFKILVFLKKNQCFWWKSLKALRKTKKNNVWRKNAKWPKSLPTIGFFVFFGFFGSLQRFLQFCFKILVFLKVFNDFAKKTLVFLYVFNDVHSKCWFSIAFLLFLLQIVSLQ